jgi:hypothetical protein
MRQVFSSPRLENVERVAQLLEEAGIETRVTHGRSYRGGLRGNFSYREGAREGPTPAVWIVRSEDQVRGRAILREAGLIESTRTPSGSFLPETLHRRDEKLRDAGDKRALRLKLGLLLVIALVIALAFLALHESTPTAPTPPPVPAGAAATPDALARAVLAGELPTRAGQAVCLSVDGHDPAPALLAALPPTPGSVVPASGCAPGTPTLAIHGYRPHAANGAGTIVLERTGTGGMAVTHQYDVRPDDDGWRVIEPYQ